MLARRSTFAFIAAISLLVLGCQREPSEEHLVGLAVKLEKQHKQLDRIDTTVQSIGERLHEIEARRAAGL